MSTRDEPYLAPGPHPAGWSYGLHAAAVLVASVSWPYEAPENRDVWATRLLTDSALLADEAQRAVEHLAGAIKTLGDHLSSGRPRLGEEIVLALDDIGPCRHFGGTHDCPAQCLLLFGDAFVAQSIETFEEQP